MSSNDGMNLKFAEKLILFDLAAQTFHLEAQNF
jgi:hypothetical protein